MEVRNFAVISDRCPAALFLKRIFADRVSMSSSTVSVLRVIVVRCELFPPALTYSNA